MIYKHRAFQKGDLKMVDAVEILKSLQDEMDEDFTDVIRVANMDIGKMATEVAMCFDYMASPKATIFDLIFVTDKLAKFHSELKPFIKKAKSGKIEKRVK